MLPKRDKSRALWRWFGLCLVVALLSGCAANRVGPDLIAQADVPPRVELRSVPFHPQEEYQCGPAALATVLETTGVGVSPEALAPDVYLPGRKGSLQAELLAAVPEQGRLGVVLPSGFVPLLREVAAGRPVLVLQNLGFGWMPQWHYAVVVGYDTAQREVVLRSGRERRHRVSFDLFDRTWGRGERWGLVVLEPGQLPVTVSPRAYLEAVVALQKAGHLPGAIASYQAAVERWPDNETAAAGLAEALYRADRREEAEAALLAALQRLPDSAVLHHNLAQVQADLGRWAEAERHAQRAVAEGDRFRAASERLLNEIRSRRAGAQPS